MLEFARWKYTLVAVVTLLALIIAAPNFFGEDLALQVARKDRAPIDDPVRELVETTLKDKGVAFKRSFVDNGRLMVLFDEVGQQLAGRDAVNAAFRDTFDSALARAPRAPGIFRAVGLRPMPLGLDLRGGLYLLYEVDVKAAVRQLVEAYEQDFRRALTAEQIAFADATPVANGVRVTFAPGTDLDQALTVMRRAVPDVTYTTSGGASPYIEAMLTDAQVRERQRGAIEQNMITLGNRVNALGVTEPIVQQQGADRIAVQLPGITNSAEVKSILGRTASLEFRLTDMANSATEAAARNRAPLGSRLEFHRDGRPTLLKRELIATGENLIGATTAVTQDGPSVQIRLDSKGGDEMRRVSMSNIGRLMGVVLVEKTREQYTDPATGELRERSGQDRREVISEATIRGVLGNQFNITGLSQAEASELALLMRSGQLAAPLLPVSERPVGPSLGQENIKSGVQALMWGAGLLFLFMIFYYHLFGVVACVVLTVNMVLLTALLSLLGASLSLPGIAGILLTVGMAVDANVIIYERVREELRNGVSPQTSIRAGFEKAWSAIWDSNVTTFIAGLVLWVFGTGPIRNFAVVLSLGILTSMFTAMLGSRALLTLIYGGARKPARLSIG
ncbi:MAG: protein translocase subunit SecD [Pseudomonadota bacterium]|nr:protein translocase subunit SecD [Pseudomonadota bacterium]